MLHASMSRRAAKRTRPRGGRWLRWLALTAIVFATPIVQQALTEVVSLVAHDDCSCEDDCNEHGECPGPCQTCFCCTHSNVVVTATLGMPEPQALRQALPREREDRDSEGHVPLLFRPPIG
jgi:hypothetical protein